MYQVQDRRQATRRLRRRSSQRKGRISDKLDCHIQQHVASRHSVYADLPLVSSQTFGLDLPRMYQILPWNHLPVDQRPEFK